MTERYYIWNDETKTFELQDNDISDLLKTDKKIYKKDWNYEKRDYEIRELEEEEIEIVKELDNKICEFCNKNKVTTKITTGGSKVYYCDKCYRELGHDVINSRLPIGRLSEEMLHYVDFIKKVNEQKRL